jgi:hypothetical protein
MLYVRRTTLYNTNVSHDVVRQARTTSYPYDVVVQSYVVHVRHRISYDIRHVLHRNIRCRMFIRYRRSDVRHCMLSSYKISYVHAYNIAYYIPYDIVSYIHSIGFRAGFGGFNWHARSRRHRSLHGNVFIQALTVPPAAGGPAPLPPLSAAAAGAAAAGAAAFPAAGAADSSSHPHPHQTCTSLWCERLRLRQRTSAYDVVCQHMMSYVSIRCRIRYGTTLETAWALRGWQ